MLVAMLCATCDNLVAARPTARQGLPPCPRLWRGLCAGMRSVITSYSIHYTKLYEEFTQGDACNLKPKYQGYDLVLAANLIDRLREPARFLADISQRLKPGGILRNNFV